MKIFSNHLNMFRVMIAILALTLSSLFFSNSSAFGKSTGELPTNIENVGTTPVFIDDFNDNMINQNWWNDYNLGAPTVDETNQQLQIDIPSTASGDVYYAGYSSKFRIRGDFDIEVAFQLNTWPYKNGVRVGIIADSLHFSPQRVSCGNGEGCIDVYLVNNNGSLSTFLDASSHTEGKFRVTRQGSVVTGYYYDPGSSNWVIISSASKGNQDVMISLQAWSHDIYFIDQDVSIAFDDFTVNEGQVIVSEIFVPLILRK